MKRLHESVVPWPSWWYERLNSALLGCPLVQLVADDQGRYPCATLADGHLWRQQDCSTVQ